MKTAVTLFCGGGVADAGLIAAGFTIVAAVEREDWIAEVYRQNYGNHVINAAVGDVDFTPYKGVDLVFGSSPCQQFSAARSRDLPEHKDSNATLEAIDAIATMQPRWIIWENVPAYRKSTQYAEFRDFLFEQGYWLNEQVIDCADLGVPQHRKRFILLAAKDGIIPQMPQKEKHKGWYVAIADLIDDCPKTQPAKWQLPHIPSDTSRNYLIPRVGARKDRMLPIDSASPCPTLRALGHDRHYRQFDLVVQGDWRILTPRCEARLMTVNDCFFLPKVNWKAKKILGNGFPSLAMEKITKSFLIQKDC